MSFIKRLFLSFVLVISFTVIGCNFENRQERQAVLFEIVSLKIYCSGRAGDTYEKLSTMVYYEVEKSKLDYFLSKAQYTKKLILRFEPFVGVCELKNGEKIQLEIEDGTYGCVFSIVGYKGHYIMPVEAEKAWRDTLDEAVKFCRLNRRKE